MAASDIVTQAWPAESAALAERVIGDASQIIPSHGKTNLARVWKTVVKGIRNQLTRTRAGTQPNVAVQVSANKIKTLYTGTMSIKCSANPSAILPNGDTEASASDDSPIDPSPLYAGTGSVGEAINSMTSDLNNAISAGSASGTPPTTIASWLRAIRNMKQSKVSMAKIAASGWGKQDLSETPAIMSAIGAADNSENTLETSFLRTRPKDATSTIARCELTRKETRRYFE
ncbi:hypothetical protein HKX48_005985 [Thoreauomyces humboldtii]|nr:hypothetical protein HKX48_005985 [Thoreauomyces humboldtii]